MDKKRIRILSILALLLIGLVFLSGCAGAKEEKPAVKPAEKPEVPAERNTLGDFLGRLTKPSGYKATYQITSGGQTSTMTYYIKGEKIRMDWSDPSTNAEGRWVATETATYICSRSPGQPWMCFGGEEEEPEEVEEPQWESTVEDLEEVKENVFYDGTERIAGVNAYCYKYVFGDSSQRACYHPSLLIPLLVEARIAGTPEYKMIATSVDLSAPADSVFVPPAQPMTMEEIMKQYGQG